MHDLRKVFVILGIRYETSGKWKGSSENKTLPGNLVMYVFLFLFLLLSLDGMAFNLFLRFGYVIR